jgi:hypothetical protein
MTTDKLPTEAMIEAGCEAMAKVHSAMRDRNLSDEPECMDDFDEGDAAKSTSQWKPSVPLLARDGSRLRRRRRTSDTFSSAGRRALM